MHPSIKWGRFVRALRVAFTVALLSAVFPTALAAPRTQSKFVVEIIPSQSAIYPGVALWKKGAPVFLIIRMTNNSKQTLHFALTNPVDNYRVTILDADGKRVPETDAYRKMRERDPFKVVTRNILVELKPHETCTDTIELSYLYDLSKPGSYTVQLERDSPPEVGTGVIVSNQVILGIQE